MARVGLAINIGLAVALETVEELGRVTCPIEALPKHLRAELEALLAADVRCFDFVGPEAPGQIGSLTPTPRLAALLANLRAGGFIPST